MSSPASSQPLRASLRSSVRPLRRRAPPAHARPLAFQVHGAVWPATKPAIIMAAIWATVCWSLDRAGIGINLGAGSASLSAILSMVTGLLVSYRSSSANERWNTGRSLWSQVSATQRTIVRTLSVSLPPIGDPGASYVDAVRATIQLVAVFPLALKYHLRDVNALSKSDVRELLDDSMVARLGQSVPLSSAQSRRPSERQHDLGILNDDTPGSLRNRSSPGASKTGNVPLAILRELHRLLNELHTAPSSTAGAPGADKPALELPVWANLLGYLSSLTTSLTEMERVKDTPVPTIISIHFNQLLILHLAAIPPPLIRTLGIWTIPVAAIAAHVFVGIDRAAEELQDPFGVQPNDLPLDRFCADLLRETREAVGDNLLPSSPVSSVPTPHPVRLDQAPRRRLPTMSAYRGGLDDKSTGRSTPEVAAAS